MRRRGSRNFLAGPCASIAAALLSACSLLPAANELAPGATSRERPAPRKIVQLGFGRDAVFAACVELACPLVTPKTLATSHSSQTLDGAPGSEVVRNTSLTVQTHKIISPAELTLNRVALPAAEKQRAPLVLYFPFNSATLSEADKLALDELMPHASKADRIVIASRTDNTGSETANQTVALARANAVRAYLRAKLRAPDETFLIDAQGSCCYIASNDTPEGRRRNRRVEIVLSVSEQVAP